MTSDLRHVLILALLSQRLSHIFSNVMIKVRVIPLTKCKCLQFLRVPRAQIKLPRDSGMIICRSSVGSSQTAAGRYK